MRTAPGADGTCGDEISEEDMASMIRVVPSAHAGPRLGSRSLGKTRSMDGARPDTKAEEQLEHTTAELDDRLDRLDDHLAEAKDLAADRRREAVGDEDVPGEDVAGDWADTDTGPAGGDDPKGAID
jgi:hypothetical protein